MLKKTVTRFMKHVRLARPRNTLFGQRGVRGLGLLYPMMFRLDPGMFSVVTLETCPKHGADLRDLFWIRKLGHTLNVCGVYPTHCKWKLLLHSNMVVPKYTKAQLARMAHRISYGLRCDVLLHVQLRILTWAKRHFNGPLKNRCYEKVACRFKQATGLTLPHQVPLRLPLMTHTNQFALLNALKEFVRRLPLLVLYRDYLVQSTRIIQVRNPYISQC